MKRRSLSPPSPLPPPHPQTHTQRKGRVSLQQGGGLLKPELNRAGTLISNFQPPELGVNKFLFKSPNVWYFCNAVHTDQYTPFAIVLNKVFLVFLISVRLIFL